MQICWTPAHSSWYVLYLVNDFAPIHPQNLSAPNELVCPQLPFGHNATIYADKYPCAHWALVEHMVNLP